MLDVAGAGDLDAQVRMLRTWVGEGVPSSVWRTACDEHGEVGYGPIESDVLYAFVRSQQPRRIVQVGAGVSTAVIFRAAREAGYEPEVTCIDPYPTSYLVRNADQGTLRLIAEPAQEVGLAELVAIDDGDVLFVDSTHTVKPGSEVNRIIFEVLPRLQPGAWVHFHDMMFPYDYSRGVLSEDLFFWNESTLVLAFLTGNSHFSVAVAMSMLHYARTEELERVLPHYRPQLNSDGMRVSHDGHFPSSLYIRAL